MVKSYKGELLLVIAAIMWSTGGLFIKMLPDLSGIVINGLRSFIAFFALLIIGGKIPKFNKTIVMAGIAQCACLTFYVMANKYTTSANAIVMQNTAPIFVMIMMSIALKKMPKLIEIGILLIAFSGIVFIFMDQMNGGGILGNILGVLAGISIATMFFLNGRKDADAHASSTLGFFLSFIIAIPFYFQIEVFGPSEIMPLLGLGIIQLGIPYYIFSIGVKTTTPTTVSFIALIEAILNPIWVFFLVGELPGVFGIIGFVMVLACVIANIMYEKNKKKSPLLQEIK